MCAIHRQLLRQLELPPTRQLESLLSEPNTAVKCNTSSYFFAIARNIVAQGNDVSIIDPINGKIDLSDGVVWRSFSPRIDHELAVITAKDQQLSKAATDILDRIRMELDQIVG